jgi:hypothetical protein
MSPGNKTTEKLGYFSLLERGGRRRGIPLPGTIYTSPIWEVSCHPGGDHLSSTSRI